MAEEFAVKGLPELQKYFEQLPEKLEKNVLRAALSKGARELRDVIKPTVPTGKPSAEGARKYGHYEGALRDSLRVSSRVKGGEVVASVKVGGRRKGVDVFYAKWVEYGTSAHLIKPTKKGGALYVNGQWLPQVDHPGITEKPFMRPALDNNAQRVTLLIADHMRNRIAKHGINVADLDFEIEEA